MFTPYIYTQQRRESVLKKQSLLCAWLDPAPFSMWRWEQWLPEWYNEEDVFKWSASYLMAVAPHVAGLKYNRKYREWVRQLTLLKKLIILAKSLDVCIIDDSKIADIGSTNDAAYWYAKELWVDMVTLAPFAWNISNTIADAKQRELWVFSMCLMSNPEYKTQKHMLVPVDADWYMSEDLHIINEQCYVYRYIHLAKEAKDACALGVVVWAPWAHNHIANKEIERIHHYLWSEQLILCPWIGAQWWNPKKLIELFGDRVMVCMSRALMFPNGSYSTPEQQADEARAWKEKFSLF